MLRATAYPTRTAHHTLLSGAVCQLKTDLLVGRQTTAIHHLNAPREGLPPRIIPSNGFDDRRQPLEQLLCEIEIPP